MLNKAKVTDLFEREAVLIGTSDAVPVYRVAELFGEKSANFGMGFPGKGSNVFSADGDSIRYLTFRGFLMAATYKNINEMKEMGGIL